MTDWSEVAFKVASLFRQRCGEIRRDIPVDRMLNAAKESFSSVEVNLTNVSLADMPVESFVRIADEINGAHRRQIREVADRLGVVESELPDNVKLQSREFLLHEEDGTYIRMSVEGITIRIEKDVAMKVAVLGRLP